MESAGKFVRQLCEGGKSCAVLTPRVRVAIESATILGQTLNVEPEQLPQLPTKSPGRRRERPAVAAVRGVLGRHSVTVVVVPACDLPSMLHAFIGNTAGCGQKTGKIVWIDTEKRLHSVL